ncbi:MAG: PAS domain S-box protein, partial [Mameliella sp.]|nr:PAS domain S-box protein [Phaeodactylibacter sp.]
MSRSLSMPGGSDLGASNQLANYQKVLDSFGFGTIVVRQDGRIHLVSNRAAQELGYEVKLLSKKRIFEINPHLSRDKWRTNWQALLDSKHLELETEFINASEML